MDRFDRIHAEVGEAFDERFRGHAVIQRVSERSYTSGGMNNSNRFFHRWFGVWHKCG